MHMEFFARYIYYHIAIHLIVLIDSFLALKKLKSIQINKHLHINVKYERKKNMLELISLKFNQIIVM